MRTTFSKLCLTALLLGLAACGGGGDDASKTYLQPILDANQLHWQDGNYVLKTSAEWQAAWNGAEPRGFLLDGTPYRPPLPVIDFSQQMVVGVVAGLGANSCSAIGIEPPKEEPDRLTVKYTISNGGHATCALEAPPLVAFVAIAQSSKPVVFVADD